MTPLTVTVTSYIVSVTTETTHVGVVAPTATSFPLGFDNEGHLQIGRPAMANRSARSPINETTSGLSKGTTGFVPAARTTTATTATSTGAGANSASIGGNGATIGANGTVKAATVKADSPGKAPARVTVRPGMLVGGRKAATTGLNSTVPRRNNATSVASSVATSVATSLAIPLAVGQLVPTLTIAASRLLPGLNTSTVAHNTTFHLDHQFFNVVGHNHTITYGSGGLMTIPMAAVLMVLLLCVG